VTTYTLGIEGGPLDGGAATADADEPAALQAMLERRRVVREPFGLEPHDPHWHYCHRGASTV
jgi:hypothetical protein